MVLPILLLACVSSGADSGALGELLLDSEAGLYGLTVSMAPDPPIAGDTRLAVGIDDAASGQPVTGADLQVTPWMPAHDHGISEPPEVVEDAGTYTVTFAYSMPGTWELTFDIDAAAGSDRAVLTVEVE